MKITSNKHHVKAPSFPSVFGPQPKDLLEDNVGAFALIQSTLCGFQRVGTTDPESQARPQPDEFRGTHPCKKRKSGAASTVVVSRTQQRRVGQPARSTQVRSTIPPWMNWPSAAHGSGQNFACSHRCKW